MKITIESTDRVVELEVGRGRTVPARIWEGTTEHGVPVHCFVTRIAPTIECPGPEVLAEFERDLKATAAPSAAVQAIPLRLIL